MERSNRVEFLDTLKGLCILFVVTTHYEWSTRFISLALFPFWIDMAVPLFMMISGYVYAASFEKRRIDMLHEAYGFDQLFGKLCRYFIPYAVAFLAELVLFSLVAHRSFPPLDILRLFLCGGVGPGSYYTALMVQFVFLYPLIYFSLKRDPGKGLVIALVLNAVYELLKWGFSFSDSTYRVIVLRYLFLIAVGAYTYMERDNLRSNIRSWKYLLSCMVGMLFIVAVKYLGYTPVILSNDAWVNTSFPAGFYIAPIFVFAMSRGVHFSWKPLSLCGKASFNIYLVQVLYYCFFYEYVCKYFPNHLFSFLIGFVLCVLGGLCFYYLEYPLTKALIKKVCSRSGKTASLSA